MGIIQEMKNDLKSLSSVDIMLAVVFGVIARLYMVVGSPLINVIAPAAGPLGYLVAGVLLLPPLYWILILVIAIRSNGFTGWLAAMFMSALRLFTGDPFGAIAMQAYAIGPLLAWISFAAFKYKRTKVAWVVSAFVWGYTVDLIFGLYRGIWPVFGSYLLGHVWFAFTRVLQALIVGLVLYGIIPSLMKIEALRGMMVVKGQ